MEILDNDQWTQHFTTQEMPVIRKCCKIKLVTKVGLRNVTFLGGPRVRKPKKENKVSLHPFLPTEYKRCGFDDFELSFSYVAVDLISIKIQKYVAQRTSTKTIKIYF